MKMKIEWRQRVLGAEKSSKIGNYSKIFEALLQKLIVWPINLGVVIYKRSHEIPHSLVK